jgi:hypothetical protein
MNKFDLWGDCPYSPTHRFKDNICVGCGLKKPKLPDLIDATRKERATLEERINRLLGYLRKKSNIQNAWGDYFIPSNTYGVYGYSHRTNRHTQDAPSAPLKGEGRRNKRRLSKVGRLYSFYEANWPIVNTYLDETFSARTVEPYVEGRTRALVNTLTCHGSIITKNQIEELAAAYTYYLSELPERSVAEEPDSIFPQVTRKTLRKWVKIVSALEEVRLG